MSSQFHKGEAVTIPDSAKQKPVPRSRDEINKNYGQLCTELGDKTVKMKGFQQEIDLLFKYVESLSNELDARTKLDAKVDAEKQVESPADSLAPETTGVDTPGAADAQA
jgi:hypothetical protein